jgi:MFS superfamily sulfate permease-like transporter
MSKITIGFIAGLAVAAVLVNRYIAQPIADGFAEAFGYPTKR